MISTQEDEITITKGVRNAYKMITPITNKRMEEYVIILIKPRMGNFESAVIYATINIKKNSNLISLNNTLYIESEEKEQDVVYTLNQMEESSSTKLTTEMN